MTDGQTWTCRSSIMFSPNIVGTANAFAGGWGNMGAIC
jgi:nitrate/nitrite transporter NarK